MSNDLSTTRRGFLKSAAATSAVLAASGAINAQTSGSDEIRVGVVGCGGRGSGATDNVLQAAKGVKIVALGDVFKNKTTNLRNTILNEFTKKKPVADLGNTGDLPDSRLFDGLNAFEQVINCPQVNYIILATPPGFRPVHVQAAVASGKNLFCEKPVAVDGTGIRKVMAAYEESLKKGMYIVTGTQRRHQKGYVDTIKQIHDGVIGDVTSLRCYWNGTGIWFHRRQPGMTDVAYQLNNWYHFLWVCGDHIVEQHVHNIDVCNWVMKGPPIRCDGAGGRAGNHNGRPNGPPEEVGHIFDHFSIDYTYPGDVHMYSSCRHIPGTANNVSEDMIGTKGKIHTADGTYSLNGRPTFTRQQERTLPDRYVQEHTDLITHIRSGSPINELKTVAESTLTAIMGRMSAYTGKPVTWEQALNSKLDTYPVDLTWDTKLPVSPVPIPGRTPLI